MRILLLMMLAVGYLAACENKEKNDVPKQIIDGTLRKLDGDPVRTHRDANGRLYHDNNIFAPRRGETTEQYKERTGSYKDGGSTPYEDGYEEGYEEGFEAGSSENN